MFSERLENIIKAALQDGILTDQEKAVIIKRAQAEGEDIDEVDIYIQSLTQKRQQELSEQAKKAATEEMVAQKKVREAKEQLLQEEAKEKARILRNCPSCGCSIPATTNVCPECGHIIASDDINGEIVDLIKAIEMCKPTDGCSDGKLELKKDIPKKEFNTNMTVRRAFVCECNLVGDTYRCKSRYFELIEEAKWKYAGNPRMDDYLHQEKQRIKQVYMDQVKKFHKEGCDDDVKIYLSKLETEYPGEVPAEFILKYSSLATKAKAFFSKLFGG